MTTAAKTSTHAAIARALTRLQDAGVVQRKVVQIAIDGSVSTTRRIFEGEALPDAHELHLLARELPGPVADEVLAAVLEDTGYRAVRRPDPAGDMDLNHDGRIDRDDATDVALEHAGAAQQLVRTIRRAWDDNRIDAAELAEIEQAVRELMRQAELQAEMARQKAGPNGRGA